MRHATFRNTEHVSNQKRYVPLKLCSVITVNGGPCCASRSAETHRQLRQTFTVRDRTGEA